MTCAKHVHGVLEYDALVYTYVYVMYVFISYLLYYMYVLVHIQNSRSSDILWRLARAHMHKSLFCKARGETEAEKDNLMTGDLFRPVDPRILFD